MTRRRYAVSTTRHECGCISSLLIRRLEGQDRVGRGISVMSKAQWRRLVWWCRTHKKEKVKL